MLSCFETEVKLAKKKVKNLHFLSNFKMKRKFIFHFKKGNKKDGACKHFQFYTICEGGGDKLQCHPCSLRQVPG